jgi:outer membrane protein OmpA-like peptidoglycan-associated protein
MRPRCFAGTVEFIYRSAVLLVVFVTVSACNTFSPSTETLERAPESHPQPPVVAPPAPPPLPPPTQVLPLDEALLNATNTLFSYSRLAAIEKRPEGKQPLVVDSLIDGVSGIQSKASRSIESRIGDIVRAKYLQFSVEPFSAAHVRKSPVVLVGTFTAVNKQGQPARQREAYRICLVLADFNSGTIVGKATALAQVEGVDHTPTPYFRNSPTWMKDGATEAHISICQASNIGDPIQPSYRDGITAATFINEAISAYESGRYTEAFDLYSKALEMPSGKQLRVYNGLYLTNIKLGRKDAANELFGKIIEHGLANKRLAVNFIFKPGTTAFSPDKKVSGVYPYWLKEIAKRAAKNNSCLEITGHTSRTGAEPFNERLSYLRAEYIKKRLVAEAPKLNGRMIASGAGSREILIGTGKDDATDALDRRIAFQVHSC